MYMQRGMGGGFGGGGGGGGGGGTATGQTFTIQNEAATGTVLNQLTRLTTAGLPPTAIRIGTTLGTDTAAVIGICVGGCGTTGSATIQSYGPTVACTFDGATTAQNYVIASVTVAGNCRDAGAAYPNGDRQQVIGRVLSTNVAAGTYNIELFDPMLRKSTITIQGNLIINSSGLIPGGSPAQQSTVFPPFWDVPVLETDAPGLDFIPIGAGFGPNTGAIIQRIGIPAGESYFAFRTHADDGSGITNKWVFNDNAGFYGGFQTATTLSNALVGFHDDTKTLFARNGTGFPAPPFAGILIETNTGPILDFIDGGTLNKGWLMQALTASDFLRIASHDDDGGNVVNRWTLDRSGNEVVSGSIKAPLYNTTTNCSSSASPAACSAAPAGSVVIAAAATTVTVNTTAVTANSQIVITEDSSLGTKLGVTCNTTLARNYAITARTAGTSFVITTDVAPVTNPACLSYTIVN